MAKLLSFRNTTFIGASVVALVAASSAYAGGFAVREQSTVGHGMAYAGSATGTYGLSGMFWNPAVVTGTTGMNSEKNFFLFIPDSEIDSVTFTGPSAPATALLGAQPPGGQIGVGIATTASYANYQVNDKLFLGVSVTTPFGLGTSLNPNWAGAFSAQESRGMSINVTPTIGYKINDQFSVAFGVQAQYFKAKFTQALAPIYVGGGALAAQRGVISGDDYALGYTLGFTWKPMKGTELGLGFRSALFHQLSGEQTLSAALPGPIAAGSYPITANVALPEQLTFGVSQAVTPNLTLAGTIEWTNWSRLQTVTFVGSPTAADSVFNYKDGWFFSVGADYKLTKDWTVRGGIAYEISPTQDAFRTIRLPDNDRLWLSIGASYDWNEKLKLSAGYSLILVQDAPFVNAANPFGASFTGVASTQLHILGVSASYKWDNGAGANPFAVFSR